MKLVALLRLSAVIGTVAALFAGPGVAAASPLPPDFPAADQYVESVPSSSGPHAPSGGGAKAKLPPSVGAKLRAQGGGQAPTLRRIATSRDLGAPTQRLHGHSKASPSIPSAVTDALNGGGGPNLLWLLIVLLVSTSAVAGIAGHRHLRHKSATNYS